MPSDIKKAPTAYDGTLGDLYSGWAKHVLLAPSAVEQFHAQFCAYLKSPDPLFLVRQVRGQERGQILRTTDGTRLRPTDNAPAWWIHHQILSGQFRQARSFAEFIEGVPCHLFQVQRRAPDNVSMAGWHVAHVFDAKDRNVSWHGWNFNELVRRAARNIHPCNYFYVPKCEWQNHGGSPTVIAFFYDKFRSRYRSIWDDFLKLVGGALYPLPAGASKFRYSFPTAVRKKNSSDRGQPPTFSKNPAPPPASLGSPRLPEGARDNRPSKTSRLCEIISEAPPDVDVREWTLRKDNHAHHHGKVSIRESPLYLDLSWRPNAAGRVEHVGLFRLDLRGLLHGGFVRHDPVDSNGPELRLRVIRANDGHFYV